MRIILVLAVLSSLAFGQTSGTPHVTAHRLNRAEYNNTIRDLLAVDFQPAADFPPDDSGYGFDNIGDVLSLSPILMEKYLAAAEKIARSATVPPPIPKPTVARHGRGENKALGKSPSLIVSHRFRAEGDYTLIFTVTGRNDPARIELRLDGQPYRLRPLEGGAENRRTAEISAHVAYGDHTLQADLVPDGPPADDPDFASGKTDKPLPDPTVNQIEIHGPYNALAPPLPESYKRVFTCAPPADPKSIACARTDLANLARRAYRRPVTDNEVDGLLHFVQMAIDQGDGFDRGMQVAVTAMLVSPHFLFRIQGDSNLTSQFTLASRLSYFLWSSMPDEELFRLAASGTLEQPDVLRAQVHRMLAAGKSRALVDNFAGQWLQLRNLDSAQPDPGRFPQFNDDLRRDMKRETEMFFLAIIHDDRGILDFIDSDYTYLNARLAKFYGLPEVDNNQLQRVQLPPGSHRGGIITQASVLLVSSYPNRTSPVLRGKWILENLLNAAPPPPPPDVPNLEENSAGASASMRQQLEAHRTNPVCNACHSRMDPLGLSLENFDAIGHWRSKDGKVPIDASGKLPNGKIFDGPEGLKQVLLADRGAFTKCLSEKLLTYALGRGLEEADSAALESIVSDTVSNNYKFSALVQAIVDHGLLQPVAHALMRAASPLMGTPEVNK
jgi:Protein of unknown function (DUF1592)/Protein of unknown function (DUF1588)/Protein of unknown function (DUF1587)/Protein of unknown function (DUF1595)/Protein of unknown function (DUF1585)